MMNFYKPYLAKVCKPFLRTMLLDAIMFVFLYERTP